MLAAADPGLDAHLQRAIAVWQHCGGLRGRVVAFRVRNGAAKTGEVCKWLRLFALAESLGGVESLCEEMAVMMHQRPRKERLEELGTHGEMIGASVGLEVVDDLMKDLMETLDIMLGKGAVEGEICRHA